MVNYILGMGRSGTSLLMSLIGSHPQIHSTPENYFSVFFANAFLHKTYFTPKDIALIHRFNLAFEKLQPYVGFRYDLSNHSDLLKNGFHGTYFELCKQIYRQFQHETLDKSEAKIVLDKNPANTLFFDKLLKINPNAKFVCIIRDYRSNALSRKQSPDIQSPHVVNSVIRWDYFNYKCQQLFFKHPEKCILVRYEDLVEAPEIEVERIFKFLEISNITSHQEKERNSYSNYKLDNNLITSQRAKKKFEDLSRPVYKDRLEKWRVHLSPREIEIAESLCGARGEAFGYHRSLHANFFKTITSDIILEWRRIPIHFQFIKDRIFHRMPISFKVKRFESYVNQVNKRRLNNAVDK